MFAVSKNPLRGYKKWTGIFIAFGIAALSLPVFLGGAYSDSDFFLLWLPMRTNSSACLLLLASAMLASSFGKNVLARTFGILLIAFGGLTLAQDMTSINLRIDALFAVSPNAVLEDFPGRMPFNSCVALILLGLALTINSSLKSSGRRLSLVGFAAGTAVALGLATILSHAFGTENFSNFDSVSYMALPTALAFTLAGSWFVVNSYFQLRKSTDEEFRALPLLLTVVLSITAMTVWQLNLRVESIYFHETVELQIHKIRDEIEKKLEQTVNALSRYASRVELLGIQNQAFLELDSENYLKQLDLLTRIGIVDRNFKVVWSYPKDLRLQVVNFDQSKNLNRQAAFISDKLSKKPVLSKTVQLQSGGPGHIVPVAMFKKNKFKGAIYGTISSEKIFKDWFNPVDFKVTVHESGELVFENNPLTRVLKQEAYQFVLNFSFAEWNVQVTPTLVYADNHRSYFSHLVLFVGEVFALLCGFLLQTFLRAQKEKQTFFEKEGIVLNRMNLALESAQIGAMSLDLVTGEIWRSQDHDAIFGYHERLVSWGEEDFYKHIVPEDQAAVRASRNQASDSPDPHDQNFNQLTFRIHRADTQEIRWIRLTTQTAFNGDGHPLRLVGIAQDITHEKNRDFEHQLDLEWRKAILNGADASIISTDIHGIIQTFNSSAEKMLGYNASEMVGHCSPVVLHDNQELVAKASVPNTNHFEALVERARSTGLPDEREWTYVRKNGTRFPVQLSITAMMDPSGTICGYLAIATDLTERKKTAGALMIAHDRLQRVIEASGEGIWEREADSQQILYIDDQARTIFGFSPGEIISYADVIALVPPKSRARLTAAIDEHRNNQTPRFDVEFKIYDRHKLGVEKWLRVRGRINTKDGVPDQLVSTLSDVTDLVLIRQRLEQAVTESEAAGNAKSAFLASMSHEIRTPLNGVIGMTDLLLETNLDPVQRNFVQIVQQSGSTLLALINDILDFSKIEAGKMQIENTSLNIATLVENQIDILAIKAKEKGISLASFVSPDIPSLIIGDSGRLAQILLNLIGNALKFTSSGGVSVNSSIRRLTNKSPETLRFEIEDTGIGISLESQKQLFKPFVQADGSITKKFGGTGLGLSISKKLVEAMGGEIGVDSNLGQGSLFWFEIPLIRTEPCLSAQERIGWEKLVNARVLLIEEDSISRQSVQSYVLSSKMRVSTATSLDEAVNYLKKSQLAADPYQVMVISSMMARQFDRLRNEFQAQLPPTILMSDFGSHEADSVHLKKGFAAVVPKPVKQSPLINSLVTAFTGKYSARVEPLEDRGATDKYKAENSQFRVLIADDVAVNQLLTRTMLEFLGYNSTCVANGLEALDALAKSKYDLILMDCQMPEMDGFEATSRVRASSDQKLATIPIIALTANAMTGDVQKCLDSGMNDYLSKPVKKVQLAEMLQKWLKAS